MRSRSLSRILASLIACGLAYAALASCRSVTPPGVYLDSDPPGAEVLVDGKRSGYVTPCLIGLSRSRSFRIGFTLEGYAPREVVLHPDGRAEWVSWDEGQMAPNGGGGPFGLGATDLLLPRLSNGAHAPNRVFLRLHPATLD